MTIPERIQRLQENICVNDCQRSFSDLFNILYPRLFEIARHYVKAPHIAEEVVMDVFLKLWNNRKNYHRIIDLKSYLFIAVKRQSLNALRNNRNDLLYIDSFEKHVMVELRNPESDMFTEEFLETLAACINSLPDKCQMVFKMVKEDNMKYKEVAGILNISEKTVEMHMTTAFKQLRESLNKVKNNPKFYFGSFYSLFFF